MGLPVCQAVPFLLLIFHELFLIAAAALSDFSLLFKFFNQILTRISTPILYNFYAILRLVQPKIKAPQTLLTT
jgi:hypothetical protein